MRFDILLFNNNNNNNNNKIIIAIMIILISHQIYISYVADQNHFSYKKMLWQQGKNYVTPKRKTHVD